MLSFQEFCRQYSKVENLARCGQKLVYSAESTEYGPVVIKLFFSLDSPRSIREIEIGMNGGISAVPKFYSSGYVDYEGAKTQYIVEQRIVGHPLNDIILSGARFSLKQAEDFLVQGLKFIQELEERNIVHRDIKPANIIISEAGKVYFIDFGIARVLDQPSLTGTGAALGPHTPGYAAIEQFSNFKKDIDSRADIFSLGVVTYECITGVNPFSSGIAGGDEILLRTKTVIPNDFNVAGDTNHQFYAIIRSMMGTYPSHRPRSAKMVIDMIRSAHPTFAFQEG